MDGRAALARFADAVDVVTYEFENVPAATAAFLSARKPVRPGALALEKTQDRLTEDLPARSRHSTALCRRRGRRRARPACRPDRQAGHPQDAAVRLRRQGPDHAARGIRTSARPSGRSARALHLRRFRQFRAGSVGRRAARPRWLVRCFDVCETSTRTTSSASPARPRTWLETAEAMDITHRILDALDYVGVIAVEMFLVAETDASGVRRERVVVNEIAPRVHNSGHWTIDGPETSQFEQHVRAIAGWPLVRRAGGAGRNAQPDRRAAEVGGPGGSCCTSTEGGGAAGRKMGHVTRETLKPDRHSASKSVNRQPFAASPRGTGGFCFQNSQGPGPAQEVRCKFSFATTTSIRRLGHEEEDAARRHFSRDEMRILREAVREARPREGRGRNRRACKLARKKMQREGLLPSAEATFGARVRMPPAPLAERHAPCGGAAGRSVSQETLFTNC